LNITNQVGAVTYLSHHMPEFLLVNESEFLKVAEVMSSLRSHDWFTIEEEPIAVLKKG
jgi:hypothetical protein